MSLPALTTANNAPEPTAGSCVDLDSRERGGSPYRSGQIFILDIIGWRELQFYSGNQEKIYRAARSVSMTGEVPNPLSPDCV
jgi:hypothetical protein